MEIKGLGPTCRCGVHRKPAGLTKHVIDDGKCIVHPDKPAEKYVRGAGPQKESSDD